MISPVIIEIIRNLGTPALTLLGIWYQSHLKKKGQPDLAKASTRKVRVKPILDGILNELGANRTCEWAVSNGDVTLSGHHLQKLSIITEVNSVGVEPVQPMFQLVPIAQFSRTIEALRNLSAIVSDESKIKDDLAMLNYRYDVVTVAHIRIHGEFNKWTGILSVSWDQPREVTPDEIAFLKLQASRIGAIRN